MRVIRKAQAKDLNQIFLFEREYIIEHEIEQLSKWDLAKDMTMDTLESNIDRMYVASINGQLVGHGYWSIHNSMPCIYSIYVIKDYRHMGIATDIMGRIERHVIDENYSNIILSTLENNPAQYLFEKMNYCIGSVKDGWISYSKQINRTSKGELT